MVLREKKFQLFLKIDEWVKVKCLRELCSKLFIGFGACAVLVSAPSFAESVAQTTPSAPAAPKVEWVHAVVVTDGGAVYSEPDFDAKVADYLNFKAQTWASRKATPGKGGLGLFHRVHYNGKSGFMADTDIRITGKDPTRDSSTAEGAGAGGEKGKGQSRKIHSKAFGEDEDSGGRRKPTEPMYFTSYVGGAFALVNYTEKFEDQKLKSTMPMYGLRMTGPGTLFAGLPLDFNLLFSLQKPGYYQSFAKDVSGFLIFGDLALNLPMIEQTNWLWTYSLGLMYTYTNFKVQIADSKFDSQEVRVGLDGGLGGAFRFGPARHKIYAIRSDVKYYSVLRISR